MILWKQDTRYAKDYYCIHVFGLQAMDKRSGFEISLAMRPND